MQTTVKNLKVDKHIVFKTLIWCVYNQLSTVEHAGYKQWMYL